MAAENASIINAVGGNADPKNPSIVNELGVSDQSKLVTFSSGQEPKLSDEDRGIIVNATDMVDDLSGAKKKKKKNKRPASKRGLGKPTGFEDFHADAPLTPEQYAESKEAFSTEQPFVERVLKAIQRFERTRKLSPERRDIFYKYLAYGGVDVGPNMFVGKQDTEEMDKDDITATKAHANISEDTRQAIVDPKHEQNVQSTAASGERSRLHSAEYAAKYVVDFEGTMRGFLSRHAFFLYPFDKPDDIKLVTTTLERFMDYLLQHDVCPEYANEVLSTRDLCRAAQTEMWHCIEAQRHLPGDLNIACSTLFGGSYGKNYDGETYWGPKDKEERVFVGLKPEKATQIVGFAIAGAASEDVYTQYLEITSDESNDKVFEVTKVITDHGFEITKIEQPTRECRDLYKENTSEFHPVGKIHAKFYKNPDAPPEDMSPAEGAAFVSDEEQLTYEEYTFFIEDNILPFLRPGMRVEATIHRLNCGVWFFDDVIRILPSFDLWLENEMMLGWKEPKPLTNALELAWNIGGERCTRDVVVSDTSVVDAGNGASPSEVDVKSTDQNDHDAADVEQSTVDQSGSKNGDGNDEHPY